MAKLIAEELKLKEELKKNNNDNFFALVLAHIQYYALLEKVLTFLHQKLLSENSLLGTNTTKVQQALSPSELPKTAEAETGKTSNNLNRKPEQLSEEVEHLVTELSKTLDNMIKEVINTFPVSLSVQVSEKLTPIQQHYMAQLVPTMTSMPMAKSDVEVAAKQPQPEYTEKENSDAASKAMLAQPQLTQLADNVKKVSQQLTLIKMATLEHRVDIMESLLIRLEILNMLSESFIGLQTRISPAITTNQVVHMTHTVELFIGMREAMLGLNKTLGYIDSYKGLKNTQPSIDFIPTQFKH